MLMDAREFFLLEKLQILIIMELFMEQCVQVLERLIGLKHFGKIIRRYGFSAILITNIAFKNFLLSILQFHRYIANRKLGNVSNNFVLLWDIPERSIRYNSGIVKEYWFLWVCTFISTFPDFILDEFHLFIIMYCSMLQYFMSIKEY